MPKEYFPLAFGILLCLSIILTIIDLIKKSLEENKKQKEMGIEFDKKFSKKPAERLQATQTLYKYFPAALQDIENNKELLEIDYILNFFDNIGFNMKTGNKISPETVHQHFYYWIRGYYSASKLYIEARRKKEPSMWNNLSYLFDKTSRIEPNRAMRKLLDNKQVIEFLEKEKKREIRPED